MQHLNKLVGKIITNVLLSQGTYYSIKDVKSDANSLPKIIGETVIVAEDYSLNISNKITLDPISKSLNAFISKKIENIIESEQQVVITSSDGSWFSIDLTDEAFVGPEAMCLTGPDNLVVVWN